MQNEKSSKRILGTFNLAIVSTLSLENFSVESFLLPEKTESTVCQSRGTMKIRLRPANGLSLSEQKLPLLFLAANDKIISIEKS